MWLPHRRRGRRRVRLSRTDPGAVPRPHSRRLAHHRWPSCPTAWAAVGCATAPPRSFAAGSHFSEARDGLDMLFMSPEGARPWKSLGLWLSFRQLGRTGYTRLLGSSSRSLATWPSACKRTRILWPSSRPRACPRAALRVRAAGGDPAGDALHQRIRDDSQGRARTTSPRVTWTAPRTSALLSATTPPSPPHIDGLLAALQ